MSKLSLFTGLLAKSLFDEPAGYLTVAVYIYLLPGIITDDLQHV